MIHYLTELGRDFKGERALEWMEQHTEVPAVAVALYLALVLYVPDSIMAHRQPMNLRGYNILWNLLLTVFSAAGAYYCVPRLIEWCTAPAIPGLVPPRPGEPAPVVPGSLYNSLCYWNQGMFVDGTAAMWMLLINLGKIPEMLDTAFLVFQKKPVIFLHWYHHLTVMLFCWHAYAYTISSGLWFATMNYCVHSIMYFYYFVCACGLRKIIRPIAPLITMLQILQMAVGTFIVVYTYVVKGVVGESCGVNDPNLRMGLMMYVSYLVLFSQLFHRNYMAPASKSSSKMANGEKKAK
ncbi:fatty acid elongase [Trypanosoma grayi]|uniref:fatty acid elongase n=1 Tax=Trypanosoma grayi TaxID=71804 RepID=UPI0004F46416|nr:fatty acid elongase [Trypanosoma grayi]KEG07830.1 fatty acid elongase [Trypanosoma grayi]